MTVVVVNKTNFRIKVLGAPLDGLGDISGGCYLPKGRIGVVGADVAVLAVDLADVFCEVPAIGVPGGIFLDGERAGGGGLRRIPCNQPQAGMVTASQITASYLEVAAVQIAMMECYGTIDGHLFGSAAAHVVVFIAAGGNSGVAAPIRLLRHHFRGGVSAGVGSSNTCVVRLREGENIRHYSTSDNATGIGERGISGWRLGYTDCFFVGRCGAHDGEMVGVFFV